MVVCAGRWLFAWWRVLAASGRRRVVHERGLCAGGEVYVVQREPAGVSRGGESGLDARMGGSGIGIRGAEGITFMLVDPAKGPRRRHSTRRSWRRRLTALNARATPVDARYDLPVRRFRLSDGDKTVTLMVGGREGALRSERGECVCARRRTPGAGEQAVAGGRRRELRGAGGGVSPDGTKAAFIRDWNLWVRDVATRQGDAADDGRREGLRVRDGQCGVEALATIRSWCGRRTRRRLRRFSRTSARRARCTWFTVTNGHPKLTAWKYPLVGDKDVTMIERVVIDVDQAQGGSAEDAAGPASVDACATT